MSERDRRRLDVDLMRVPDVLLTIDGKDYAIRGSALFGDDMLELADIETRLMAAKGDEESELAREGSAVITRLVRRETPDAPDFDLNAFQVLAIFMHLVGADSVTAKLIAAIQDGLQGIDAAALETINDGSSHSPKKKRTKAPASAGSKRART
jgi:hypothetical protein